MPIYVSDTIILVSSCPTDIQFAKDYNLKQIKNDWMIIANEIKYI